MGFTYKKANPENKCRIRIELPESLASWVDELASESGDSTSQVVEACVRFAKESSAKKPRRQKTEKQAHD